MIIQNILFKGLEVKHSQYIISQLIESIISQIKIPLELSKLEGDAVFLYAIKDSDDYSWDEVAHRVGEKLMLFFEAFHDKLDSLGSCSACTCGAWPSWACAICASSAGTPSPRSGR